ncbi:MAG TPA: hypothetical protein VNZ25_07170 [Candidatus Angelobacter sp.]|nr:hypothetical protein [Candidatus Angelobacter sp.]
MKPIISKFAASLQTPVYPKAVHQPRPAKASESPQPPKRDNIFSKSRDTREDRGTRIMKTSHSIQRLPHAR